MLYLVQHPTFCTALHNAHLTLSHCVFFFLCAHSKRSLVSCLFSPLLAVCLVRDVGDYRDITIYILWTNQTISFSSPTKVWTDSWIRRRQKKHSAAPPGIEPGSSDCRSDALTTEYPGSERSPAGLRCVKNVSSDPAVSSHLSRRRKGKSLIWWNGPDRNEFSIWIYCERLTVDFVLCAINVYSCNQLPNGLFSISAFSSEENFFKSSISCAGLPFFFKGFLYISSSSLKIASKRWSKNPKGRTKVDLSLSFLSSRRMRTFS